jgi:DNA-binding NtrC family response regulator
MNQTSILLIEDEKNQRVLLRKLLEKENYQVAEAENGKEAIKIFSQADFDLVLLDQRLPDITGIEVLKNLKESNPIIPVIILTAYANVKDAVDAMKQGAFHYLTKPVEIDELLLVLKKAQENLHLKRENEELRKVLKEKYEYKNLIATSSKMQEMMSLVYKAASSDANVLISGESGTGKELIAGAVHNLSKRKDHHFVPVHLAALPETLMEAELFGHEKGAFTGAEKRRIGKFEFAVAGTIFLDEIGELPQSIQVKLLRVLQEKKITRLGSNELIPVDVRIITATNKDIEDEIKKGRFRDDLYYRLNVIRIQLPALRERKEDIPLLVDHFIRIYAKQENKDIKGITDAAMKDLMRYNFPGNVRELENIIERAVVFSKEEYLQKDDLPNLSAAKIKELPKGKLNDVKDKIEKEMIELALKNNEWNQTKAASELGISERVLRYKMKNLHIKHLE